MPGFERMRTVVERSRRWAKVLAQRPLVRSLAGVVVFCVVIVSFGVRAAATTEQLLASTQSFSPGHVVASFALILFCFVWAALTWWTSLWLLGGRLEAGAAMQIYFLSLLPRYIPGLIWGYVGRTYLCEQRGVARSVAVLSSVVEIALFVGSGLSIGLMHWVAPPTLLYLMILPPGALAVGLTVITPKAHPFGWMDLARIFLSWYLLVLTYYLFWILYGISLVVLVQAITPALNGAQVVYVISAFAISWLVGFAAVFVPGGLGVREAGIILALEPLTGSLTAVFIAVLARCLNLTTDAFLFLAAMWRRSVVITR